MNRAFIPDLTTPPLRPTGPAFTLSGATMGTTWGVRGFGPAGVETRLAPVIAHALDGVVREMSQWAPDSELSRFNAARAGEVVSLPDGFSEVLACALAVAAETDGAFDPTLGALVDLWGFGPQPAPDAAPSDAAVDTAVNAAGWRKLEFDAAARRLVQPGGVRLDFAGIAKGYAVDQLARIVAEAGIVSYLVEIGGELRGAGAKPDGQPWWVEIERPPGVASAPIVAALYDLAIATSGDYRRGLTLDGRLVSHTLDPRAGRPLESAIAAVTVLHATCMRADAYATALMVMGPEAGLAFAERLDLAAMFTVRTAMGFEELFSPAFARQLG